MFSVGPLESSCVARPPRVKLFSILAPQVSQREACSTMHALRGFQDVRFRALRLRSAVHATHALRSLYVLAFPAARMAQCEACNVMCAQQRSHQQMQRSQCEACHVMHAAQCFQELSFQKPDP